ncbi:MAG: 4Fe-4S binding protein [Gammaproteobacteria bacterium]|uniref:4Fe-4S dicluster domain-containing protein n=1 Tax=Rhodoferax sp. TaxID=50421 RepID=UPI0017C84B61|nr:4Fe-4S dicluster domain-containing protein [Rhodoferax sp.]MBU3900191.1 4Fe-4S binding protein [Gammaproteobacteria bacterium]MBA3057481.1 4Fe-4S dicluster domain-containing protein [Rhodoferax sp.]MBU3999515.1 4Fe-4S binding protein [Gammaproteobacteria bacterium]MBU4082255.1 4Fe-4S binding protein [Gammaproteobacteria bacterium]MBU4112351.1 4Fe-4S binding protein [Gammaproteobacteria bacterium]
MPEFRANHCTRYRYRYSECRRCADACPHDAITLSDEGAALLAERCQNCALCISACHTKAWSSDGFKPIDILRTAIKKTSFSLACESSGCQADALVPCLGAVDAVWLAYMAKRRLPVTLYGSGHCGQCVHGKTGAEQLRLNLEAVDLLASAQIVDEASDTPESQWVMPTLAEDGRSASQQKSTQAKSATGSTRRSLFGRLFRGKIEPDLERPKKDQPALVPAKAIRAGAYMVSDQRELLQIVCKQRADHPFTVAWHERLPLMQLSLQSGCTLCEACFRVCPTGAIQIEQNPHDWALTFQIDRCVACEVCLEVCQPRVLDAQVSFDARPGQSAITLIQQAMQRCSRCDRHFASPTPQKTCPICSDDEEAFDAIFGAS